MACCNLLSRLRRLKKNRTVMTIALCSVICLSQFQRGVEVGYMNFAVEDINSPSEMNPFHININQQSWLTSVAMFGSMAGVILSAPLLSKLERQEVLLASCLPSAIGWLTITCAGSVNTMYAGRIIVGLAQGLAGGAAFIYLIEIARPDIRGAISLFSMMGVALGKLFVYVIGDLIAWNWTSLIMIGLTLVVTVGLSFIPENPKMITLQKNEDVEMKTTISLEGTMQTNNETEYVELENIPSCSTDDSSLGSVRSVSNAIDTERVFEGSNTNLNSSFRTDDKSCNFDEEEESSTESNVENSLTVGTVGLENSTEEILRSDLPTLEGTNEAPSSLASGFLKAFTKSELNLTNVDTLKTDIGSVLKTESSIIMSGTLNKVGRPPNSEGAIVSDSLNMSNYEIGESSQQISSDTSSISAHLETEDAFELRIPEVNKILNSGLSRSIKSGISEVKLSTIIDKLNKVTGGFINSKTVNVPNSENDNAFNEDSRDTFKSTSNLKSNEVLNSDTGNEFNFATESVLKSGIGGTLKSIICGFVNKVSSGPLNSETTNFPNLENSNALNLSSNSAVESFGNAKSKGEQNSALGSVFNSKAENALSSDVENAENIDSGIEATLNPGNCGSLKAKIGSEINLESLNSVVDGSSFNFVTGGALNSLASTYSALGSATGSESLIGKALNFNCKQPNNSVNGTGVISNSVTGNDAIDLTTDAGLNSLTSTATNEANEFANQTFNNIAEETLNAIPGDEAANGILKTVANSVIGRVISSIGRGISSIVEKVKQVDDKYTGGKVQMVTGEVVKVLKKFGPNKVLQLIRGEENGGNDENEINVNLKMLKQPIPWADLFKTKNVIKYLGFCVFMQIVSTMGGVVVLNQYSVTIFKLSRTNLSENTQTLLLAVIGVVFTIVCSLTIDLMSRKRAALISLLCEGFFMLTLGIYFYVDDYVDHAWAQQYIFWLPLVSFIMFQIFLIWSDATIFAMSVELFSTEFRGRVSPILLTCRQLFLFFGAKGFLKLIELIKLCGGFWVCAAINVAGGVFYVFLVPETAKKSLEQIQSELNQESSEV